MVLIVGHGVALTMAIIIVIIIVIDVVGGHGVGNIPGHQILKEIEHQHIIIVIIIIIIIVIIT